MTYLKNLGDAMAINTIGELFDYWQLKIEERERLKAMSLVHCFDAATPPAVAPAHCAAVLGYMGGADAARTWSLEEWRKFGHLRQFGAWVPDVKETPEHQADTAVTIARQLGFHEGRAIVGDMEAITDREWWERFAFTVTNHKYLPVCYGSLSTVLGNAGRYVWVAAWDGIANLVEGQTIVATQYAHDIADGDTKYDLSVVSEQLLHHSGHGPRT